MSQLPKNHHWVKFNYKDWLVKGSIRDCDAAARGIYMDLYSVAMSEDNVGIIVSDHKKLCKRLGLKFTQFERTLKQLINVKLCVIGKNNEIILTEIASDYSSLVAQQDLKENPTSTQREPNGISTRQGNDSIPPKIEPPIIKKNRVDIEKKESPQTPQSEIMTMDDNHKSVLFNESLIMLSQTARLEEEKCRPIIGRWLKQLGDNADTLISLIDKGLLANAPIPYISKMVANASKVSHGSNVTYFQPRKTHKQQMTEALGLCSNVAEFQEKYGDDEPTLEQLQSHNPRKAWGF